MVRMGMLLKLYRDVYYIIPLCADPWTYAPDSGHIAGCVMKGKDYYIGYSSAMQILGLSKLSGSRTVVVTNRQVQPSIQTIAGQEFQFINHTRSRFFGYQEMWVTTYGKAMVSDLEKTIVDALSKPGLCGGIILIGKAIYHSGKRTDQEKLFYYLARNRIQAAKKRYLYITDTLEMNWTPDHERMLKETGSGISLLDPSGPDRGVKKSRFGLKINIEAGSLKKSRWL
ncbi:MAG: type IV toxin-antitoxin system AbiEi family antitoxin domain-containing protein [Bacteroidales bacterium]